MPEAGPHSAVQDHRRRATNSWRGGPADTNSRRIQRALGGHGVQVALIQVVPDVRRGHRPGPGPDRARATWFS